MSELKTDEQNKAEYVEKMGEELGSVFHALSNEVSTVRERCTQFVILFGKSQSRIDLMNQAAGSFFGMVQALLIQDIVLAIARLVGPMKSVGYPQLTLERLASENPALIHGDALRQEVAKLFEQAKAKASFALEWRHRRLAHRELELSLGRSPKLLNGVTREQVEGALSALRKVLNAVERAYCQRTTAYCNISPIGDAQTLLYVMREGLLRRKERFARRTRGEFAAEDAFPEI